MLMSHEFEFSESENVQNFSHFQGVADCECVRQNVRFIKLIDHVPHFRGFEGRNAIDGAEAPTQIIKSFMQVLQCD